MGDGNKTEEIILDACSLINLFASGRAREILAALPARFIVASYVSEREALYTQIDPAAGTREQIDLAPLVAEGLIQVVDLLTDDEVNTFVDLTMAGTTMKARLEDGEAATCALARHRGYTIATDERKVLNRVRQTMPSQRARTTSELVKWWHEIAQISGDEARQVIRNIETRARFTPNRQDPFFEWWNGLARTP